MAVTPNGPASINQEQLISKTVFVPAILSFWFRVQRLKVGRPESGNLKSKR